MKKVLAASIFIISLLTMCKLKVNPPAGYPFYVIEDNYDTTKIIANQQNKNIFLMVHADWCSVCNQFKSSVLNDTDVKSKLENKIITSLIDGDKAYGKPYASQYGVVGFPTMFILDASGNVLVKRKGGMDKATFLAWVNNYLK
jgi:thioredoxin 1